MAATVVVDTMTASAWLGSAQDPARGVVALALFDLFPTSNPGR